MSGRDRSGTDRIAVGRRRRRTAPALLALTLAAASGCAPERADRLPDPEHAGPGSRVVVVSLDGLGQEIWEEDGAAGRLAALRRIAGRGAVADGMIQAFPSSTPGAHAALWTGAFGDVNGITAPGVPLLPRAEHGFLDRGWAFDAHHLRVEPLWVTAARQGVRVVANQASQNYPFIPFVTAPDAAVAPVLASGYGPRMLAPHRVLSSTDMTPADPGPWAAFQNRSSLPIRVLNWELAGVRVHAVLVAEDAARPSYTAIHLAVSPDGPSVRAAAAPLEDAPPAGRARARHFSEGLLLEPGGSAAGVAFFRLFELAVDGGDFLLYHASVHELALHDGAGADAAAAAAREWYAAGGGFVGNGPSFLWRDAELGRPLYAGGDGTAERRYLEGLELVLRQYDRLSAWLVERYSPELLLDYSNYPDEVDHWWFVLADAAAGPDPAMAEAYQAFREWAYAALDRRVELLDSLAGPDGTLIVVSDHGMASVTHEVAVDRVLEDAGLLHLTEAGEVDPASSAVYLSHSVLLNTEDWKGGVVPLDERAAVLDRVEAALAAVRDPRTGGPVFTAFFRPETDGGVLGIGGPAGGDLYFDLAAGFRPVDDLAGEVIRSVDPPRGDHGFLPTRRDMLAVFIARGPDFEPGSRLPTLRAVDVAPTVAAVLGIGPPAESVGRSVLPPHHQPGQSGDHPTENAEAASASP